MGSGLQPLDINYFSIDGIEDSPIGIKKKMKSIVLTIFPLFCCASELFIEYGAEAEGQYLAKYFSGVEQGFFVDIGAYDPIFASNTLNLHTQGWSGLNVDASPSRMQQFYLQRPGQINIFSAIGDNNTFVTLYEMDQDSSSTVSKKVQAEGPFRVRKQIRVPSMNMSQLCHTFFLEKPLFLNLDIEGYGSQALLGNDWDSDLCRPELIMAEANEFSILSGLPLTSEILPQKGYKRLADQVGLNEVYVEESKHSAYLERVEEGTRRVEKMGHKSYSNLAAELQRHLGLNIGVQKHHNPSTDQLLYHFCQPTTPLILSQLIKNNNRWGEWQQGRPIIALHFRPDRTYILAPDAQYTLGSFDVEGLKYFNLTFTDRQKGVFYILDHNYGGHLKVVTPDGNSVSLSVISDQMMAESLHETDKGEVQCPQTSQELKEVSKTLSQESFLAQEVFRKINELKQSVPYEQKELKKGVLAQRLFIENELLQIHGAIKELESGQQDSQASVKHIQSLVFWLKCSVLVFSVAICVGFCHLAWRIVQSPISPSDTSQSQEARQI